MRVARLGHATALVFVTALFLVGPASAQMDSRDAIALQNQILELRQQMQMMQQRRGCADAGLPAGSREWWCGW